MIAAIIILLFLGLFGITIGCIMDLHSFRKDEEFSWKPLIFCMAGSLLFAIGVFLNSTIGV